MNEQLLKASGTDILSSRKKLRKTIRLMRGGERTGMYVRGLKFVKINNNVNYDVDDDAADDDHHDDDDDAGGDERSHQNP